MTNDDGDKYLTAGRLAELLATLPGDSRVMPNMVGNLLLQSADGKSVGFIDFLGDGELELWFPTTEN